MSGPEAVLLFVAGAFAVITILVVLGTVTVVLFVFADLCSDLYVKMRARHRKVDV